MPIPPHPTDDWIPPCDLCGGFGFDPVAISGGHSGRRCRSCGLIALALEESDGTAAHRFALPPAVVSDGIRRLGGGRVLLLGPPDQEIVKAAQDIGVELVTPSVDALGASHRPPDLENLRYAPESFDGVMATEGLEWFDSPSLVFERSRLWLRPAGTLVVGAWDIRSLPARLRRRSWMRLRCDGAHHLMSLNAIRRYAARYGFYIGAVQTRTDTHDVASSVTGNTSPSWFTEMATAPIALASALFGMGPLAIVRLSKGGLSARTIRLNSESESKNAPGLAPAMYVGRIRG